MYISRILLYFLLFTFSFINSVQAQQTVLLVSIDGFRWDYIEKHQAKNLAFIAKQGTQAEYLEPVYPSKTFPNHLSLITGLSPSNHGIIDNQFCDKNRRQCYSMGKGREDSTWLKGIPLWNLAELHGVKAATYFWPESDARFNGLTPSFYYHYTDHSRPEDRVEQIKQWLKIPQEHRPKLITTYFSMVDSAGHTYGPDAKETFQAVQHIDNLIGQLHNFIRSELVFPVNLVVVSDHGMARIDPNKRIEIEKLGLNLDDFIVKNGGSRAHFYKKPDRQIDLDDVKSTLTAVSKNRFTVLSEQILESRGVSIDSTTADIIIETEAPHFFSMRGYTEYFGAHGYPFTEEMGAIFIAEGPAYKRNTKIGPVKMLDIYPNLAKVLGLNLLNDIDGDGESLMKAMR